jgi:hypothetical protein
MGIEKFITNKDYINDKNGEIETKRIPPPYIYFANLRHEINRLYSTVSISIELFEQKPESRTISSLKKAKEWIKKMYDFLPVFVEETKRIGELSPENLSGIEKKLDAWEKQIEEYEKEVKKNKISS